MIIHRQAIGEDIAHKVEILCPACSRDVDTAELAAKKCNECGADLSKPQQNIAVAVTSVPTFAVTF